jgi:hypothetical protein
LDLLSPEAGSDVPEAPSEDDMLPVVVEVQEKVTTSSM